jgi:hypothetical protein
MVPNLREIGRVGIKVAGLGETRDMLPGVGKEEDLVTCLRSWCFPRPLWKYVEQIGGRVDDP